MGVVSRRDVFEDIGPDLVYLLRCLYADGKALLDAIPLLLDSISICSG